MTQKTAAKLPLLVEAVLYYAVFSVCFALLNRLVVMPVSLALRLPPYQNISPGNVRFTFGIPDIFLLLLAAVALVLLVKFLGITGALTNVFLRRAATLVLFLQCTNFTLGLLTKGMGALLSPKASPLLVYGTYFLFVIAGALGAGLLTKLSPREAVKVAVVPLFLGLLFGILHLFFDPFQRAHFAEITRQLWPLTYLPIPVTLLGVYGGASLRQTGARTIPRL